jgi:GNAT superfamily N-acetyltransferase
MAVEVREVASRRDLLRFIKYPWRLYGRDPCYVRHLLSERKRFFGPGNPVFQFTHARYFLARDGRGRIAGRVTAHVNDLHNGRWNERTGFFGFFECADDLDVAAALMGRVEQDLRAVGMDTVRGPFSFSTNHECGLLTEGYDSPPSVMMPHGMAYYPALLEGLGYRRADDLIAYNYRFTGEIPARLSRFASRAAGRASVAIRAIAMARFEQDVARALTVYNRAWEKNRHFVPMTPAEIHYVARALKPIIVPDLALVAEHGGEPVAFLLALPDYNVVLKKVAGRLLPFGFLRVLRGKGAIHRLRVLTLGVIEEYRGQGIEALLIHRTFERGLRLGYTEAEFSWVLEDNRAIIAILDRMGAVPYKRYTIYEKPL